MRQLNRRNSLVSPGLTVCMLLMAGLLNSPAQAQVRITSPTEGQDVRGEITVRFEGVPAGGYAMIYMDGKWQYAIYQNSFSLNTFPPNFPGDGPHTIKVVAISAGRPVGEAQVTFNIANNKIETGDPGVLLTVWKPQDMIEQRVYRYLIFAESSATIEGGKDAGRGGMGGAEGGGMGGAMGGMGGRGGGRGGSTKEVKSIPAPLDYQLSALIRRMIRDVGMLDNSANIQTVVQRAFQRKREEPKETEGAGAGQSSGPKRRAKPVATTEGPRAPSEPGKAAWGEWEPAPEVGQYFVKTIKQSGEEVNSTRKSPTIALTDLMPRFPNGIVRPGSTWESPMTFITELSTRAPLNVQAPITFTTYDKLTTPLGRVREVAKLEARFRLPEDVAFQIAETLAPKINEGGGGAGGAGAGAEGEGAAAGAGAPAGAPRPGGGGPAGAGGGPGGGGDGPGGGGGAGEEITVARSTVTRVLWFDIENNRVLRSEDVVDTYFEIEQAEEEEAGTEGEPGGTGSGRTSGPGGGRPGGTARGGAGMGGAGMGGAGMGGAQQAPAEPTKVTYNLHVTTWMDDSIPAPTDVYNAGAGTAHARDDAQDPTLDRIMRPTP